MERKCFVKGCKNEVTLQWEINKVLTLSCDNHKILDNNILGKYEKVDFKPIQKSLKTPTFSIFYYFLTSLLLLSIFLVYSQLSFQNLLLKDLASEVERLKNNSDINYKFYSEIFQIREYIEKSNKADYKPKQSVFDVVDNIKTEVNIFSAEKYSQELSKKESLLALSNPDLNKNERSDFLLKNLGFSLLEDDIFEISFLLSGTEMLLGTKSGVLYKFNLENQMKTTVYSGSSRIYSISPSHDYSTAVFAGDVVMHVLSLSSLKVIKSIKGHSH